MGYCNTTGENILGTSGLYCSYRYQRRCLCLQYRINIDIRCVAARSAIASGGWLMMELIERRDVASQKVGVRLYFSQNDLVILILVPNRRNGQPLVLVGIRAEWYSSGRLHTLSTPTADSFAESANMTEQLATKTKQHYPG